MKTKHAVWLTFEFSYAIVEFIAGGIFDPAQTWLIRP